MKETTSTNFSRIVNTETIAEINKMNLILTCLAFVFSFSFMLLFDLTSINIISMVLKSGFYMLTTSFTLTYFLKVSARKFPYDLLKFRIWRFFLSFFTAIAIQLILWPIFAFIAKFSWDFYNVKLFLIFVSEAFIIVTIILLLQDFIILRYAKNQVELDNSKLLVKTTEAENFLLKQQIHPHFLFNSLNTLKAVYKKDTILGETYLILLADFLRSTLSNHKKLVSTLREELFICENYLKMQKIRFGDALNWELKLKNENMLNWYLPSFSLQPLLENAIKHNNFTKNQPLNILIVLDGDNLIISNPINAKEFQNASIKSGLINLAERYQLWCGDDIVINNDGNIFSVGFKLYKNESSNN